MLFCCLFYVEVLLWCSVAVLCYCGAAVLCCCVCVGVLYRRVAVLMFCSVAVCGVVCVLVCCHDV